jgi:uncharacterized protein
MLTRRDLSIVEELKDKLLALNGKRIHRIILYGSHATGTFTPESDFDLLVVEADPVSKREEMSRLRETASGFHCPIDVRVMGEEEFQETKDVIGGLAYPAHKYGLLVYEIGSCPN